MIQVFYSGVSEVLQDIQQVFHYFYRSNRGVLKEGDFQVSVCHAGTHKLYLRLFPLF